MYSMKFEFMVLKTNINEILKTQKSAIRIILKIHNPQMHNKLSLQSVIPVNSCVI